MRRRTSPYSRTGEKGPFGTSAAARVSRTIEPMEATTGGFALTELVQLQRRAERAQRRVNEATTGSPDWDAAMAELEEVEAWLAQRAPRAELIELVG